MQLGLVVTSWIFLNLEEESVALYTWSFVADGSKDDVKSKLYLELTAKE